MPEPEWINLVKCGFGMYEKRALLLCSSCSVNYYDYSELSTSCDCCSQSTGIFGQRLEDTVQYERKFGPRLAPLLVEQCVDFIRERGLDEEGLFRMPGQANLVKELQEAFDCGDKPLFDSNTEVHTVASLLKLYLRELPEPVIPFSKYEDFLTCAQLLAKMRRRYGIQELGRQVSTLPLPNYNLLKYICKFLDEVQSHCHENKMGVQNLATVFGPNILRPKMEDPVTIMEGTSLVQHLMTILIREHIRLYSGRDQEGPTAPQTELPVQGHQLQHRSLGAWISEEDLQSCPVSNPDQEMHSSASSLDAKLCAAVTPTQTPNLNPGPKLGLRQGSRDSGQPSKQGKAIPSWKYSFKSSSAPRSQQQATGQQWGLWLMLLVCPRVGRKWRWWRCNWLMNGLSSLRGHRRTSSGERSARDRDSTGSSQRLSTYDNVTSSSSMGSVPSVASTPWSTSSCEISVPDSASDPSANQNCGVVSDSGEKGEWIESQQEIDNGRDGGMTTEPSSEQDSCEAMELCSSSAACSENGNTAVAAGVPSIIMSEDGDGTNLTLSSLVEGLKDELRKQKTTYETRIQKLEESSAALCAQMERLEQEMEQEKKKQRMLEIKLRNSERAREDAENRNRLLEKEMEDFFSTLGDLALGARTSDI
ncbi:rho GTPase-activating protein 22-like [Notolabrus celidotus]|uniref:rho GTPase-activating protein 22-like n=1 Tax=Notolabrus celidotus TaxID=1203425 RepID=UPI00148FE613|nr:rho GTPase-activating protein 22-like [Notolabrus celidotus]